MKSPEYAVLTVAITAKRFGYAIFEGVELVDFGIKSFSSPRTLNSSKEQAIDRIRNLCHRHSVRRIVFRIPSAAATSSLQRFLVQEVALACKHTRLSISFMDPANALREGAGRRGIGKSDISADVIKRFPELRRYAHFQNRSQREYYFVLVSAVLIGILQTRTTLLRSKSCQENQLQ
jgi:hypothetical protein